MRSVFVTAILLLVFVFAQSAWAQEGTIAGTVVDSATTDPVPGANVVISDLGTGEATDENGEFRLPNVPVGSHTVEVSFVGYETKEIPVEVEANETTDVRVQLVPTALEIDDVVVTALGVEREERSLGYSVGSVEGADLEQAGETNFISTLTGKTAGARISNSSQMGGSARIELRGASSISGDNQPLIVIDGVPIDNSDFNTTGQATGSGGYDYGNAASMINPSDVESVSILKGASAAALYGSRASNGVIEITTRDGSAEEGIGVTIQTGVTAGDLYNFPNYQNEYGGGASSNFATNDEGQLIADFGTDQSWGPRLDGREVRQWYSYDDVDGLEGETTPWEAHPNNVENYYRPSITSNTNVSFSQGGETYNYRLSLNNVMQRGSAPRSDLQRQTVGFNGSIDLSDRLSATVNGNFTTEAADGRPGSGYTNANGPWLQFNHFGQRQIDLSDGAPMQNIQRPDGTQRGWNWNGGEEAAREGDLIYANNPYWIRRKNFTTDDTQRLYGRVQTSYDLTNNLVLSANIRTDYYTERRDDRIAIGSVEQPQYEEDVREVQETNASAEMDYDGQITEDVSFEAFGGVEYRYNSLNRNYGQTSGGLATRGLFTLENSISRPSIDDYFQEKAVLGLFGDVTFGYNDFVYVGGTLRNDWASTLPEDNNSYLYPSVDGSFVFSSLPALEDADILSFGRIRASWSQVGRDTDPYQLSFTYPLGTPYGQRQVQSLPSTLPNPDLQRELVTSWEVGTNLQLFDNRVGIDATYYASETTDLIQQVSTSRASGFSSRVLNAGSISNRGVELTLDFTPVITEEVNWDVQLNWAMNENNVESLAEGIDNLPINQADNTPPFGPEIVAREGEELGTFWGNGFVRDSLGNKVLDSDGSYQTEGPKVLGSYRPDWTASVSTTLTFGNVTASVLLDGQKGGDIWSLSNLFGLYSGMFQETVDQNIRQLGISPEGVLEDGSEFEGAVPPRAVFQTLFGNHEAQLFDASHIKLREARISYRLPQQWFTTVPVQQFRISVVGRNLATLLKYTPHFDPTAITRSSGNLQGIEAGQLPPKRTFGVRLQASF